MIEFKDFMVKFNIIYQGLYMLCSQSQNSAISMFCLQWMPLAAGFLLQWATAQAVVWKIFTVYLQLC